MTSYPRRKPRRDVMLDHPVDCGVFTYGRDRRAADDTRTVEFSRNGTTQLIGTYGLFVGHGGRTASELCARNFVPTLLDDLNLSTDPVRALENACQALEAFVLAKSALDRAYYGTTVLFVLLINSSLYVVNIGNSRALLATHASTYEVVTNDHDCNNPVEVDRVHAAGGFFHDGKVNDLIRVTRSIGDLELKGRKHVTFPHLNLVADVVIPTPDIHLRQLSSRHAFVVMASPEVCRHLSNPAIVHIVRQSLRRHESSRTAAKRVAMSAVAAGAMGPLTVMLLIFASSRFPDSLPSSPTSTHVRDDIAVHSSVEKETRVISDVPAPERRKTNPSIRPSTSKRLAASAARQLRAKGKWSAPPLTVAPPISSRRGRERREHSAGVTVSSSPPTESADGNSSAGVTTVANSVSGRLVASPESERRPASWRSDDEDGIILPANVAHANSEATVTVPMLSLLDSAPHTASTTRPKSDRIQSALCIARKAHGSRDVTTDADEGKSGPGKIESPPKRKSRGKCKPKPKGKHRPAALIERRQSHAAGLAMPVRRVVSTRDSAEARDTRDPRERRDQRGEDDFLQASSNHRRGSGPWPISELTSSTTTGRPSSRNSTAEVDQQDEELLDYGAAGPAKVRYREDGTTHHGRLGFFRELGWALGRRR